VEIGLVRFKGMWSEMKVEMYRSRSSSGVLSEMQAQGTAATTDRRSRSGDATMVASAPPTLAPPTLAPTPNGPPSGPSGSPGCRDDAGGALTAFGGCGVVLTMATCDTDLNLLNPAAPPGTFVKLLCVASCSEACKTSTSAGRYMRILPVGNAYMRKMKEIEVFAKGVTPLAGLGSLSTNKVALNAGTGFNFSRGKITMGGSSVIEVLGKFRTNWGMPDRLLDGSDSGEFMMHRMNDKCEFTIDLGENSVEIGLVRFKGMWSDMKVEVYRSRSSSGVLSEMSAQGTATTTDRRSRSGDATMVASSALTQTHMSSSLEFQEAETREEGDDANEGTEYDESPEKVLSDHDHDGDGKISLQEIMEDALHASKGGKEEQLTKAMIEGSFKKGDVDGDGFLSLEDIPHMLAALKSEL